MVKILWKQKEKKFKKRPFRRFRLKFHFPQLQLHIYYYRKFIVSIILIFFVTIFVNAVFLYLQGDEFKVNEFEVYGVVQLSYDELFTKLKQYENQNIFSINTNEIKENIHSTSIFLKEIYIEKILPNKLTMYVVERFPRIVIINLQGAFLIDQENVVIEILSKTEGFNLTKEEIELLAGYQSPNSKIIEDKMKSSLTDEEKKEFDFSKVDELEKQKVYDDLSNELKSKIEEFFLRNAKAVSGTEFANLNRVFLYDNTNYEIGTKVKSKFTRLPADIAAYFRQREEYTIEKMLWYDNFTLVVNTLEGKSFIFSDRRDTRLQTEDLDYMLNYLKLENKVFHSIDVTSSVISVK